METLCVAILNKQKCHFLFIKLENRRAEQILSGMVVPGGGIGYKKGVGG
jgi:hypothetical protein